MFNCNIFESLYLSCFCYRETKDDLDGDIYKVSKEYKITILPITHNIDIDNLYPVTDHVELWNIFIIGNDKTYILANINDKHINIPNNDKLLNHKAENLLPDELRKIFDKIWDKTLSGKQLQFYMVWNSKLYFINTYPFFNGKAKTIGAILFMRMFESMPDIRNIPEVHVSLEKIDKPRTSATDSLMLEDSTSPAIKAARSRDNF
jgi:hypothetical protein